MIAVELEGERGSFIAQETRERHSGPLSCQLVGA